MKDILPGSGYNLVVKILESHPDDAIETMLKYSNGAECDSPGIQGGHDAFAGGCGEGG